jgi:ABC-type dipeptide/oligopeptide/nickel transport system permease component
MKKLLAILLLLVFSIQVIPVKEIGELLCSGQMTEEVPHACNDSQQKSGIGDEVHKKLWHYTSRDFLKSQLDQSLTAPTFDMDEALIKCIHLDVALQPPNC